MKATLRTLAVAGSAIAMMPCQAAAAATYIVVGTPTSGTSGLFNGSFTLGGKLGAYTLDAFSATYAGNVFDLSNTGIVQYTVSRLVGIGGTANGVNWVPSSEPDFAFMFDPKTGSGHQWLEFLSDGELHYNVKFSFTKVIEPPVVPEPATWAMMVLGVGVIGGALRHERKRKARVAFA